MHWRHKDRFWTFRIKLIVDGYNEGNTRKLKLINSCAFGSKVTNKCLKHSQEILSLKI